MLRGHQLCDDGKPHFFFHLAEDLQSFQSQSLEGIRAGPGLERAAPQEIGAGGLYSFGHGENLLKRFYRAGAGDQAKMAVADLHAGDVHHGVIRMEGPVGQLVRLLYVHDLVYIRVDLKETGVDAGSVADTADDGLAGADYDMCIQSPLFHKRFYAGDLFLG